MAQAGCQKPLRRKPARGPQPNVKPAASTHSQSESRAAYTPEPGRRRSLPRLRVDVVTAPAMFDGPIDNPTFRAYVEQVLVPTLRRGDVVVLNNLAVHKQPEIRTTIEAAGGHLRSLHAPRDRGPSITSVRFRTASAASSLKFLDFAIELVERGAQRRGNLSSPKLDRASQPPPIRWRRASKEVECVSCRAR